MEKCLICGLEINKIPLFKLLFNKTMFVAYILILAGFFGIYEVIGERYFSVVANAHASGIDPTNPALIEAMKNAVFGHVGEVTREVPWTLFIVNYMYMIYTGSGIIFLVALAELLNIKVIAKTAAAFMTLGLAFVFAGLFTIATDLNILNMLWMFKDPNFGAGMWLMLPLYSIYIPFVLFEIYLLITNKKELVKKVSFAILVLSIVVDIVEFYIQAKLFSMNTSRHLWTEFPILTLYFIISAFVASLGVMGIFSALIYRNLPNYHELIEVIRKALLFFISVLALYEIIAYLYVDKEWAFLMLFGPFKYAFFGGYILLTMTIPFLLIFKESKNTLTIIASVCVAIGAYVGRYLFVYGGNANPMTNRFGVGFEKYDIYDISNSYNYVAPHMGEILIVIGSFGIMIFIYKFLDEVFDVSKVREH
ncbi:MAG: polysulfide reductase [Sulfurospirillaceae bacterium]|nr:polysulfide reductase [Sulfurospirillaceae bacterium]MDD3463146.1 polysulfide reductase [Sulfurospirillaceae bacterium]